ncbi:MAG: YitT family protein [Huintestinicola sp.]
MSDCAGPKGEMVLMDNRMSRSETAKRYGLFIVSLFIQALGVAVTKKGGLGVSPISSVPNVLSIRITSLTMGNWLIIWNCILILGQIILLRKKFRPIQLLQVPLSFLFGYFCDIGLMLTSFFDTEAYFMRLAMVITGTVILGLGIALAVTANVIMNSGEAFVKALSDTIHKDFGNVKIAFDISCVALSVILSLLFFDFRIVGTREGTVFAAVFTGIFVKLFTPIVKPIEKRLM